MNSTLSVNCLDTVPEAEVSVTLVVDQSISMNTYDSLTGQTRFQWVKEGVASFLNSLKFVGRTQVCLISF